MVKLSAGVIDFFFVFGLLCGAAAASEHAPSIDGEAMTLESLLDASVRAHGGPALEAITSERRVGTLVRGALGRTPFEIISESPGRWRWVQTFAWGDQVAFGCNGNKAWIQDSTGTAPMPVQQELEMQLLLDPAAPLKLRELFQEMEITGSKVEGDRKAVLVAAKSHEGVATELLFDPESGLLLGAGGMRFEDYREVEGVLRPFRVLLGSNQGELHREMRMDVTEIVANVDPDDAIFETPTCRLDAVAAPLYKERTQVVVDIEALESCVGVYQHPAAPEVTFTVTRQDHHLMFQSTGGGRVEIKPQSETDYFIQFLNLDLYFVKDEMGIVTHLEMGAGRALRAPKVQ